MRHLRIANHPDELAQQAADMILESARQALQLRGVFRLCLAGGSTPRKIYRRLAEPGNFTSLVGGSIVLYWGDERCVPPVDLLSNFRMVNEELIRLLPPGAVSFHRMEGESDPVQAANRYEDLLRCHFSQSDQPTFDLVLLGMGDDGHTASLFPGTAAVYEKDHWVLGHYIAQLSGWRLTLTPPVLNRARCILFLVAGETKAGALTQVLTGDYIPQKYPAQIIQSEFGEIFWLVDRAAASQLPNSIIG